MDYIVEEPEIELALFSFPPQIDGGRFCKNSFRELKIALTSRATATWGA